MESSSQNLDLVDLPLLWAEDLYWCVAYALAYAIGYGIYFIVNILAVNTLLQRPSKRRSTWILLFLLTLIFLSFTTKFTGLMAWTLQRMNYFLVDKRDTFIPFMERLALFDSQIDVKVQLATVIVAAGPNSAVVFVVGDVLTLWRALAIGKPPRYLRNVMYFLWVSTFTFWLAVAIVCARKILNGETAIITANSSVESAVGIAGAITSILANVVSTGVISVKAYRHKIFAKSVNLRSQAGMIAIFIAESGVVYAMCQIVSLALACTITPSTVIGPSYFGITFSIIYIGDLVAAMYAPLIIFIVSNKWSIEHTVQTNPGGIGVTVEPEIGFSSRRTIGNFTHDTQSTSQDHESGNELRLESWELKQKGLDRIDV